MSNDKKQHQPDHESDPARTPGDGWVGEGGASHLGPATNLTRDEDDVVGRSDPEMAKEIAKEREDDRDAKN